MKLKELLILFLTTPVVVFGQNVGINTDTPQAMLHVKDSSVLFTGPEDIPVMPGPPPVSGPGIRMMWYADKAAFRAGGVSGAEWDNFNIGDYSLSAGWNTTASQPGSVALGSNCTASSTSAIAMGESTTASGDYAISLGRNTQAFGLSSIAGGFLSNAIGDHSTAIGLQSQAIGIHTVALGYFNTADGFYSFAAGSSSSALGLRSVAIGTNVQAIGTSSLALGVNTIARGSRATSLGLNTEANGYASMVLGMYNDTIVGAQGSVSPTTPLLIIGNGDGGSARSNALVVRKDGRIGVGTNTPSARLHVKDGSVLFEGIPSIPEPPPAFGPGTRMFWYPDKGAFRAGGVSGGEWNNIGDYSFAAGWNTTASEEGSVAIGYGCTASSNSSAAIGRFATASDLYAISLGYSTQATGFSAFAGGSFSNAIGDYSTAIGNDCQATGSHAVAFGTNNTAVGANSTAAGEGSYASGLRSVAIGTNVQAVGTSALAAGVGSYAIGLRSVAIGSNVRTTGSLSLAVGANTIANGYASMVLGLYNDTIVETQGSISPTTPLMIIGNGDGANARSNALVVRKDGNVGIGTNTPANPLDIRRDGTTDTAQIVLALISNTSNRPVLQFSETAESSPTDGMSIEYNGSGSFAENKLHIRGTDAIRRFTIMNNGRTGIGTETPGRELSIFDIGDNNDALIELKTEGGAKEMIVGLNQSVGAILGTVSNTNQTIRTNNTTRMTITGAGNVGIGTSSPSEKLHVVGDICYTGSIGACSDIRYKTNFNRMHDILPQLEKIGAYSYFWKTDEYPDKEFTEEKQIGIIAQEVSEIFPEIVLTDDQGYLSVDYSRLSVILLAAIKEQQTEIKRLQGLEKRIALLEEIFISSQMKMEPAQNSVQNN